MNLIAWRLAEIEWVWYFVMLLPILLIVAKRAGNETGAKVIVGALSGTLLVILIFDPEMLVVLIALPLILVILLVGWIRRL